MSRIILRWRMNSFRDGQGHVTGWSSVMDCSSSYSLITPSVILKHSTSTHLPLSASAHHMGRCRLDCSVRIKFSKLLKTRKLCYRKDDRAMRAIVSRCGDIRSAAHRSSLLLWHPLSAPLTLRGTPAPAPLPLTGFSTRSAHAPLQSYALKHFIHRYSP